MQPFLAYVVPLSGGGERPDQGLPGGPPLFPSHGLPPSPGHPDQGLPPTPPGYVTGGPVPPGGPVDPSYGRPGWSPVDPGYGLGGGFRPSHGLPPVQGLPSQPIYIPDPPDAATKPPPPEVYPPLPPGLAPALILVWVIGVGYRWIHSGAKPDNTLPPATAPTPV